MARKWAAILAVIIVVLNIFGLQMFFVIRQINTKQTAQLQLANTTEDALAEFKFNKEEFESLKRPEGNNKELVIGGKLYDVKSIKRHGNRVLVYALYDGDEEGLIINFTREFEKELGAKGESGKKKTPVKMVIHEYTKNPQTVQLTVPDNTIINLHYSASELVSVDINVQNPPPDTSKHILSYNGSV